MSSFLYITVGIAFVILFGFSIWLLIILFKEKDEPLDSPIVLNFLSSLDHGYFVGVQVDDIGSKDGRHLIKMLPRDVSIKEMKDIKEVPIIVGNNKLITLPKGSVSKHRNVNILLPKHANDFPESIKNTEIGRALMMAVELQNAANAEIRSLLEGHNRKDEILQRLGHAELSKEYLAFQEELYKDTLRSVLDSKLRDKSQNNPLTSSLLPRKD